MLTISCQRVFWILKQFKLEILFVKQAGHGRISNERSAMPEVDDDYERLSAAASAPVRRCFRYFSESFYLFPSLAHHPITYIKAYSRQDLFHRTHLSRGIIPPKLIYSPSIMTTNDLPKVQYQSLGKSGLRVSVPIVSLITVGYICYHSLDLWDRLVEWVSGLKIGKQG